MAKTGLCTVGRRKKSIARVHLYGGTGKIKVNGKKLQDYLKRQNLINMVNQPLVVTGTEGHYDIKINVKGGGTSGQAGAIRLGIARAILLDDDSHRKVLKENGFLTRDSRAKERQKYGQPGARKKFQFSKR
ncbi:MAG TPA: 30S ribosomal protein S9 [Candidatus Krumholzibacteriaceae bacterium]|nr:30S ribosomal protein S9 [Candidatus Krumholzibacteriaceae bacterium]